MDDDEDEEEAPSFQFGKAESSEDDEHTEHPAAWLYLPDLTSLTGWGSHPVPKQQPEKQRRQLGFRR
jgi:hypothetical protein